jgi:hypothetical protein
MRDRIAFSWLIVIALMAVGCSNAGAPSTAGSSAGSSGGALLPSLAIPSGAIPSVSFSTDPALAAMLPDTLCGTAAVKSSFAGETFGSSTDADFQAFVQALGKTPADVSFAAAIGGTTGCSVSILRVKGADATQLRDKFTEQMAKDGNTTQEKSLGGKTVLVGSGANSFGYVYFKDDMVFIFTAPDEAKATEIVTALP